MIIGRTDPEPPPGLVGWRRERLACTVLATLLSLVALMPTLTVGLILDRVIHTRALATLAAVLIAFLFFHFCEVVFTWLNDRLLLHMSQGLAARAEDAFLERLAGLGFQDLESLAPGLVQERYAARSGEVRFLIDWAVGRVALGVGAVVTAMALLLVHAGLGAMVLALTLAYGLLLVAAQRPLRHAARAVQALRDKLATTAQEAFAGSPTLRAHGAWTAWLQRWRGERHRHDEAVDRHSQLALRRNLIGLVYERLTQAAILGLGAMEAMDGRLSIGQLVILNLLFRQLSGQLRQMAQLIQRRVVYQASRRAGAAFWDALHADATATDPARASEICAARGTGAESANRTMASEACLALAVRDLSFRTRDGQWVLRGLDFELPAGATLGLVGASGAGKSTLLKLLCGLYRPTKGGVWREGRHCDRMSGGVYLSQKEFLFGGTVGDNILLGRPAAGAGPDWLLSELDLLRAHRRGVCGVASEGPSTGKSGGSDRLPQADDLASGLSGGERQRVFLARALQSTQAMTATGLFLDEPTTALDPDRSRAVAARMWRAAREVDLLVFATHDLTLAAEADYLLWLGEGRQLAFGPSQLVLSAWRAQAGEGEQVEARASVPAVF